MLLATLALAGWSSAAAEEVNYNGGTLTQEWKSTNILENPTHGRFAYGKGNQFYIHNNYVGQIQLYDQNGATETTFSTRTSRNVSALGRDDAGNWVIRLRTQQGPIDSASPEFRIISADGEQTYDITLPSSIIGAKKNGNSFLYMGAIAGNLLSEGGAKLMFTGAREDAIYVMQIRNGALVESESFKATMNTDNLPATMPIKYSTESYVNAWQAADGTTHYLYVTRSDNPIDMVLQGQTLICTALDVETQISPEVPHRGQSNGFWMFAMGGKNYMVLPCLPNWLDGFLVVLVNDDGSMVVKAHHVNDYQKKDGGDGLHPYETLSSNWLNSEPIDDHSCYIYQYFPWGYMARYIFTDSDDTPLEYIVNEGTVGDTYTIADDIWGIYIAEKEPKRVYAKDLGRHRSPSRLEAGQVDYVRQWAHLQTVDWDQSNWVLLDFDTEDEAQRFAGRAGNDFDSHAARVIKGGTITGVLTDKLNPTMRVTAYTEPQDADEYDENRYVTANFMTPNVQTSPVADYADTPFFFVKPKAQEYVWVKWATYEGETSRHFKVPQQGNVAGLQGGFTVDWSLYPGKYVEDFVEGKTYDFRAIVRYNQPAAPSTRRAQADVREGDYTVFPLEGGEKIITAVTQIDTDAPVVDVTYVNLMGMQASQPFEGVNLVIARHSDGTVTTTKVIGHRQ